jgi:uncharacterized protein
MRYNVAQLLKEPIGSTRSYQLEEVFAGAERIADRVSGTLRLLRTHQGVLATGNLQVDVTLDCGRCLEAFTLSLSPSIEEEYFPLVDVNTGRRAYVPEGAEGSPIDVDHVLDLTDVVRQSVITHLPMKPLCADGCPGLCQQCGANWNRQSCHCWADDIDPRWRGLANLLSQQRE